MRKKILICIHNPFALDNLFETIKSLSDHAEITVITTNYLLDKIDQKKYLQKFKTINIQDFLIIPYYHSKNKDLFRGIISITKNHFFLTKIKNNINFKNFDLCISDGKFFIWQRIIIDKLISTKCITVGLGVDAVLLPLDKFRELIQGQPVMEIVSSLHKLRETPKKRKKNSYFSKIKNIFERYKDILLDRTILSIIFFGRNFKYGKLDFQLMETKQFDYRVSFFYSSYFFWDKVYQYGKCYWSELLSLCRCEKNKIKNKALFICTLWQGYGNNDDISENIDKTIACFRKLKLIYPDLNQIDFRFHPMENEVMINFVKEKIKNFDDLKINFDIESSSLQEIACNYIFAIGVMSGALLYLKKFCKNIDVYCLKELSEKIGGKYFYLKLMNEGIKIYDEKNESFKDNLIVSKNFKKTKKYNFNEIILSFLNKSKNIEINNEFHKTNNKY